MPLDALAAAVDESRFAGTRLVAILGPGTRPAGSVPAGLPPDATVLVAPDEADAEPGAFEALVGAYAAALDRGVAPEAQRGASQNSVSRGPSGGPGGGSGAVTPAGRSRSGPSLRTLLTSALTG